MFKPVLVGALIAILGFVIFDIAAVISLSAGVAFAIAAVITSVIITFLPASSEQDAADEELTTLYVGNLPYRVHEGEVRELFAKYGFVNSVRLVRDRKTGRRKGFGFVEMSSSAAKHAMKKLNDHLFQERTLKVREAKSQERTEPGMD